MSRVLVVRLGAERVALPIDAVREVVDRPTVLPVPLAPAALRGQVDVRGAHLPLLDLAVLLAIPRREERAPSAPAVALVMADGRYALAVDDALDFWDPGEAALRPMPAGAPPQAPVRGLLQEGSLVALVVDVQALTTVAVASLQRTASA